jgi:Ni,Fe-hydrogenase I cytochrome b subunit
MSTDWIHDGEQVREVSKPYVNGLWKCLRWYTNFNINSKSKKRHNSVKVLDRVTSFCLQIGFMMVNKCAKFQSHYVNGDWKYLRWYANYNIYSKSKKWHNSVKILDRVTSSCLQVWVMMVNEFSKFQSHVSIDFENIWGGMQT